MRSFRSLSADTGMLGWLWLSAALVFIDQWTKWMAEANLEPGESFAVFPHLNMTLAYNTGAAFSFLSDMGGVQRWFFAILAIAVSAFIINWLRKLKKSRVWVAVGLTMVLGGAIGNLIDRLLYGKVIDFIDVYFDIPFVMENYHFAIFNVADIAITCGAILLVLLSLFTSDLES
ncbi:signal peptidase II [Thiothrix caldifontis]|jgi:lipoprotein signal peptidase|uniref:Lipoprotein signal peptidase n=1 Tax=Thiothrix caldifontis TaxID=525918 RepID=A0A1H3Z239_9GAMM|nr:signal peptidase II [Thiothrix caldifontis]SEA17913.1 signal peptidase II [Thiothrix caldifontis]